VRALITGRAARFALGVAVSGAFLVATLRQVDLAVAARLLLEVDLAWVVVALGMVALELTIRAARWRILLRPFRVVPYRYAAGYLCVGYFANMVLPARLGDLARAVLAGRKLQISQLATLGTIIVERLADGLTILAFVIVFGLVVTGISTLVTSAVLLAAAAIGGIAVLVVGAQVARRLRLQETRRGAVLLSIIRRIAVGATALHDPRPAMVVVGLTLAGFGVAVGAFLATAVAVSISLTPLQAIVAMGALALSTALPAAPGSLGTYEFVGVAILTAFGVAPEAALATVVLFHAMVLLLPATLGLVTAWLVHFSVREVMPHAVIESPGAPAAGEA
jgi:hypothetical protein